MLTVFIPGRWNYGWFLLFPFCSSVFAKVLDITCILVSIRKTKLNHGGGKVKSLILVPPNTLKTSWNYFFILLKKTKFWKLFLLFKRCLQSLLTLPEPLTSFQPHSIPQSVSQGPPTPHSTAWRQSTDSLDSWFLTHLQVVRATLLFITWEAAPQAFSCLLPRPKAFMPCHSPRTSHSVPLG